MRTWEERFYNKIGVVRFKTTLEKDRSPNARFRYDGDFLDSLKKHKRKLWFNGITHTLYFVIHTAAAVIFSLRPTTALSVFIVAINIFLSIRTLFFLGVQRYNMIRINRMIEAQERRLAKRAGKSADLNQENI